MEVHKFTDPGGQLFARVGPQFPCIVFLDSTLMSNHIPSDPSIKPCLQWGSVTNRQHRDSDDHRINFRLSHCIRSRLVPTQIVDF
jgi:hypothetical protein